MGDKAAATNAASDEIRKTSAVTSHVAQAANPQRKGQRQHGAKPSGNTFAAFEAQKHWEAVTKESREACQLGGVLGKERTGQQNGGTPFAGVSDQGQEGGGFVPGAQHVGGADIARPDLAQIAQTEQPCHNDAKGGSSPADSLRRPHQSAAETR